MIRPIAIIATILMLTAQAVEARTTVSWLTADPGEEIYQLEGHSALRLYNDSLDVVVNWGVFDFNAPAFAWRFALGETDYIALAEPTWTFVEMYTRKSRLVHEQILDLDSCTVNRLISMLSTTLRPENRTYRYNYVLDNCATRPLDYIIAASSDSIILPDKKNVSTFREEMTRYHGALSWYQFGIDLCLGRGIDAPISYRQTGFAPVRMREILNQGKVKTADGETKPLVLREHILNPYCSSKATGEDRDCPLLLSPLFLFSILAILVAILCYSDYRGGRISRWGISSFFIVQGLAGCLLTFLVFFSTHYATSPNWLYLWLNPLVLIPAVTVWFRKLDRLTATLCMVEILAIVALIVIFALGIRTANPSFWPLIACSLMLSANFIINWRGTRKILG